MWGARASLWGPGFMAAPGRLTEVAGAGRPVVRWEPQSPFCQILGGASCFLSNAQFFVKWETLPHTGKKKKICPEISQMTRYLISEHAMSSAS